MIYIDEHIFDFDLKTALEQISPQRREQALNFKFELGQRTCVLAYLLLKRALKEEFGISENPLFEYGEHGKPFIVGHPEIHFNISHCKKAVACAVSRKPIGIDVETIHREEKSLIEYTMNAEETAQIMSSEQPGVAFTLFWTLKEARLKVTGEGITCDLKKVLTDDHYKYTTVECLDHEYIYTVCEER